MIGKNYSGFVDMANFNIYRFCSLVKKHVRGKNNYQNTRKRHDLSGNYCYDSGKIKEIQAIINETL